MGQTTTFKVPFEDLRGKLATKQKGILYSGQAAGTPTAAIYSGKHSSTNFRKYIVAYNRNGQSRFYVKSKTTINQTQAMRRAKSDLAFARVLVDFVEHEIAQSPLTGAAYNAYLLRMMDGYNREYGTQFTSLRTFLMHTLIPQIHAQYLLGYDLVGGQSYGVTKFISAGIHDYTAKILNADETEFSATTLGEYLRGASGAKSLRYFADQLPLTNYQGIIEVDGVRTNCIIPTNTDKKILDTISLAGAVDAEIRPSTTLSLRIYDLKTQRVKFAGRQIQLYKDAALQTLFVPDTDTYTAGQILYGKPVE